MSAHTTPPPTERITVHSAPAATSPVSADPRRHSVASSTAKGSAVEESEFSAAERATLMRTFKEFDADGSETIDLGELKNVMQHLGVQMDDNQLAELVQQANVNEDGELEFEAFAQLISIWKDAAKLKVFDSGTKSLSQQRLDDYLRVNILLTDSWERVCFDGAVTLLACVLFFTLLLDDVRGAGVRKVGLEVVRK